jgi:tripartite-type tricarboxylate transporter receptor subunit TctC
MAASAPPDGYTIFMPVTSEFYALAGAPDVAANLPLRLERDFKSVAFANSQPLFVGASLKTPFNTVAEMIALAKQKPGGLSYATTGRGRLTHLAMELLQSTADIKVQMVSYNGGAATAMSDLTAGRVEMVLEAYAGLAPMFTGGLLKGFATTAATRVKAFPDIPAIAETVPGYSVVAWGVFVAPLGTPTPVIAKLNADIRIAQQDPDLIARLAANGGETHYMSPAELTEFVGAEQGKWLPVLEKAMKTEP